jgi:arginase
MNNAAHARRRIALIGCPVDEGAGQSGCLMGTAALRIAGLATALEALGHDVADRGNVSPVDGSDVRLEGAARNVAAISGWTRAIERGAFAALTDGRVPIFLGGDHALSMGSVSGAVRHAAQTGRPLHVLWLDAHSDFNTPATSPTGNMHGMPVAFFCGYPGFGNILPADRPLVTPSRVHLVGIRSIDADERRAVAKAGINVYDMRSIDEFGIVPILRRIIGAVEAENAMLHVSLDVDYLDPAIAPGVGTTVQGGATYREAHLVMEMLCDSALVSSLDLVELNPFLDERGKSAILLTGLVASLFGQRISENTVSFA